MNFFTLYKITKQKIIQNTNINFFTLYKIKKKLKLHKYQYEFLYVI